ncbi:sensor domain-containing protein [Deinococcus radiotolerans]|uniref:Diguanylate cyclase with PAS/PAC sensor n=1 Tax=Deinococcus radiotolerans TaxID=1309407 RepID=A0ABQ2FIZ5_9DEIO|nr:diguanylate cyclase [Deinococcus radiotolerans]GGK99784.1 hypothetical protein GCM10010844_17660 [Deinococcus radiotolerans]
MSNPICAPEHVPSGSFYLAVNPEGTVTAASAAARHWLRTVAPAAQDLLGQPLLSLLPPGCLLRAQLEGTTVPAGCGGHCQHLRADRTPDGLEFHAPHGDLLTPHESLARTLNEAQAMDEVISAVLTHPAWQALDVYLALFDPVGATLRVLTAGPDGPQITRTLVATDAHPLARALQAGNATASSAGTWTTLDPALHPAAQEVITLPLVTSGRALGQLILTMQTPGHLVRVSALIAPCVAALDRARLFDDTTRAHLRYRTLLEITHAALWELDRNFAIQGHSPNWEALTGQAFDEYIGHGYLNVVHPDDRARLWADILRGMRGGIPFELRGRMRRADGQYRHVVALALPVPEERGNGQGWAGSIQDVTEEVWAAEWEGPAQQLLTLSVQGGPARPTFHAVLAELQRVSGAPGALLIQMAAPAAPPRILAAQGDHEALREQLRELPDASTALNTLISSLTHPTWLRDLPRSTLRESRALLLPLRHEERLIALALLDIPDGTLDATTLEHLRWLQSHLAPIMHSAQLRDALERSEDQARSIVSALDEGVIMISEQGQFLAANRAARDLLELPRALPHVSNLDWGLHDERGQLVTWQKNPAATAQQTGRAVRQVLLARRHRDGHQLWLSINAIPLDDRSGVVVSFSDVTEAVTLRQQLTSQAFQDDLTGLGNRRAFQRAVRDLRGPRAAALLIDIDHFKEVNDTYGHHVGDDLLRELAARLCAHTPDGTLIARLGGDEFGLMHPDLDPALASDLAVRLVDALGQPVHVGTICVHVSASVGVAVAGRVPDGDLHRAADLAMYAAKHAGKAGWRTYTVELDLERLR